MENPNHGQDRESVIVIKTLLRLVYGVILCTWIFSHGEYWEEELGVMCLLEIGLHQMISHFGYNQIPVSVSSPMGPTICG